MDFLRERKQIGVALEIVVKLTIIRKDNNTPHESQRIRTELITSKTWKKLYSKTKTFVKNDLHKKDIKQKNIYKKIYKKKGFQLTLIIFRIIWRALQGVRDKIMKYRTHQLT